MPGLESECTKVFLSHLMGKWQLGSSCCISCSVGAGGCINSGIKRTFRALDGCGLKEAKNKVQACQLCLATVGKGCSQSVTCPGHAGGSRSTRADDGKNELAKRGWQLHKGVRCASDSLVGAVKFSINNTEYPQVAVWFITEFSRLWHIDTFLWLLKNSKFMPEKKKNHQFFLQEIHSSNNNNNKSIYYREIKTLEHFLMSTYLRNKNAWI